MQSFDPIFVNPIDMNSAVDFGKENLIGAVFPYHKLTDRKKTRKYTKEALAVANELQAIVDDFVDAVHNAPAMITYKTIYAYYLDLWTKKCNHLKARKLKSVVIDRLFFSHEYGFITQ